MNLWSEMSDKKKKKNVKEILKYFDPKKRNLKCILFGHKYKFENATDYLKEGYMFFTSKCSRCGKYKGEWVPL